MNALPPALPEDADKRKEFPIYSGFIKYFPHAIAAVANLSYQGNQQHSPGQPLHWAMEKSTDEPDALMRHLIGAAESQIATNKDREIQEATRVAWRGMANLQRLLTGQEAGRAGVLNGCPEFEPKAEYQSIPLTQPD